MTALEEPATSTAPAAEAEGAAPSRGAAGRSFLERLEALADRHYHHRHPFNALMHGGRLDRDDLRLWVENRYYYQTRIPIKDALIVAKAEDQAFRKLWVQRLLDHDGRGDPREPNAPTEEPAGLELWRRLGGALGVEPAELASGLHLLPEVKAACDEYVEGVRAADLVTAVAYSLTEYFAPRLMQLRIEAWLQHYPFVPEEALAYFKQRVTRARGDAETALAFVQEHARTEAAEQRCLEAFRAKCGILWRLLDAVYMARRRERVPNVSPRAELTRGPSRAPGDALEPPGVLLVSERALQLNHTAHALLQRCDGRRRLSEIAAELAEQHATAPQTVERDIATFVADLERRRVLTFESAS